MKKLIPIFLLIVFALAGCDYSFDGPDPNLPAPETYEELYTLYNEVDRGMTKQELDERYGEPTPKDYKGEIMYYTYYNENKSGGVSVYFNENYRVTGKTLFYNNKDNLIPFSNRYIRENIANISEGMTIEEVIKEMGSTPLEVTCTYGADGPESSKNIYYWCNEDGSILKVDTENGTVKTFLRYE